MSFLNSSWLFSLATFCIGIIFLGYKYFTREFNYWKKRGVYTPKPIPFFGNLYDVATLKLTLYEYVQKIYDETEEPYFGMFIFDKPVLLIKSPKLIKDILIKDFNVFCDRTMADVTHHNLISKFIYQQKYQTWKSTKTKMSSVFSSGMMKTFFTNLELINKKFTEYLENISGPVDAKYIAGHFGTEMIARCFFATDPRCFEREPSKFRHFVHRIFQYSLRNKFIQTGYFFKPNLVKFFKLNFIEDSVVQYFEQTFLEAMECRKGYSGKPVSMVDVVNDLEKACDGDFPDQDLLVSNAIFLLIAGPETTASIISFALYELALNPDIQEKLRNEIKDNYEIHKGFTYEGIQKNKYLDMVVHETLRKYGVIAFLDREAVTDYRLEGTDLVIEKGMTVYIPVFATMRDPKHFPNPEQFDPERFADTNVNSDGLIYFPFGEGPKACIGKRLGHLAVAACLSHVLLKFNIGKCETTPDPVEFETKSFTLQSKCGLLITLTSL
ncbi:cytochrome P450 6k1-like [Diabrotica virgifera virgifera]|uniref:Cytochrome P450 6k1-like n=1 Tax=Diabrotica virgifera virgifera TaxID=50390 RepID=A0ABM5KUH8_DIAVI|nr:cytochrome P450 6k1-like [Diabrotica virgifera virgifera]